MTKRYLRKPAAEYLSAKLSMKISVPMLDKWATQGTGPAFNIILAKASYSETALDAWADAQLSTETPHAKRHRKAA